MLPNDQINQSRPLIEKSQSILIAIAANPTYDVVAASLGLYLSLSAAGKQVNLSCSSPMTVGFSHLIGLDRIKTGIQGGSGRNLIISFPYQEGSIEKVSYNIEQDMFNLVIEPREGYPQITPENIRYSFSGGSTDLIITVGATSKNDLQALYAENQQTFENNSTIVISTQQLMEQFGKIQLVDPTASSVSEIVTRFLSSLGLRTDADIATNLLAGISIGSNNFTSPTTTVTTFETSALLLRNGARKPAPATPAPASSFPTSSFPSQQQRQNRPTFTQQPPQQPGSFQRPPINRPQAAKPFSQPPIQQQPVQQQQPAKQSQQETPSDWLKPKIYKSSSMV